MELRTNRQARIALLSIAVLLNILIVLITALGIEQLHRRHLREAEIQSQNIAQALDMAVSEEIRKIDLSLRTVIAEIDRHPSIYEEEPWKRINSLLHQQKASLPETEAWSVTDARGRITFHSSTAGPAKFSIEDRPYFQKLKADNRDRLHLSKPMLSRITNERIVVFARRFNYPNGMLRGLVVIPLRVSYFNRILSEYDTGRGGTTCLRFDDFELLTRILWTASGDASSITESSTPNLPHDRIWTGSSEGTFQAPSSFDEENRITSFRKLAGADLYAVAGISVQTFLKDWRDFSVKLSVVAGLCLLSINALLFFLFRLWLRQQRHATELRSSLEDLQQRDRALLAAQEAGNLGTYTIKLPEGYWVGSQKLHEIFSVDASYPHTIAGWESRVHPDDQAGLNHHFYEEVLQQHKKFDHEYRIVIGSADEVRWVHGLGVLEFDANGQPVSLNGTISNTTARRRAEERLKLTQEVFQSTAEGILVTDKEGTILETNPAFTTITGYSYDEARGRNPRILRSDKQDPQVYTELWQSLRTRGRWDGELINQRKDGSLYTQQSRLFAIYDARGEISHYCAVISDITALKTTQKRLEHIAYHDELTGLANRILLTDRMLEAISECRRNETELLAVCHLDIDSFKEINDAWGQAIGDEILIQMARRLSFCIRAGDTVARLGGDEFVVVLGGLKTEASTKSGISRLIRIATEPYLIDMTEIHLTVSVGVTIYPYDPSNEPDVLIRHADQAMYDAKRSGKNSMRFFDPEIEQRLRNNQEIHDRLIDALARDELCLYYQPKVDLKTGRISGLEALVRWDHPEKGLLPPGDFLPAIEATDLTLPVGEWILHKALQQRQLWLAAGLDLPVSVNIFSRHLQRPDFVERLDIILSAYPDLDPQQLELEIVETTALEDIQRASKCIEGCKKFGIRFALDDFGTGFSSLTYLRQLAAGTVKIDRSFVKDILHNQADHALVNGIISMAHSMGRDVVAEGVETIEHGTVLLRSGCNHAQGYGIARPMRADAVAAWVESWTAPDAWKEALQSNVIYFSTQDKAAF